MLRLFTIDHRTIREMALPDAGLDQAITEASWIDAHEPSDEQRSLLQGLLRT